MIPFRILYLFTVAGMASGTVGWYLSRMAVLLGFVDPKYATMLAIASAGVFVGPTVCAAENTFFSGLANAWRDALIGLATGIGGGLIGGVLGGLIFQKWGTLGASSDVIVRILGFVAVGVTLGAGQALHPPISVSRLLLGAVGGFVGGLVAGLVFWIAGNIASIDVNIQQAVALILISGSITLAVHLIVSLGAHAELVGDDNNIPKYDSRFRSPVFRDVINVFGSGDPGKASPKANLQIRANDPDIDQVHAVLEWAKDTNRYILTPYYVKAPEATNQGVHTYVDGVQITQPVVLRPGNTIQFGRTAFKFNLRRGAQGEV